MKRPALGPRGTAFWDHCMDTYELSEGEIQILAEACRTMDVLDMLGAAIMEVGNAGPRGEERTNPHIGEARQQRLVLSRLINTLRLPDADGKAIPNGKAVAASAGGYAKHHRPMRQVKAG